MGMFATLKHNDNTGTPYGKAEVKLSEATAQRYVAGMRT